jgi:hypothetical protein
VSFADLAAYKQASRAPHQCIDFSKNGIAATPGRLSDLFITAPDAGATPTTAEAPTRATTGALGQRNPSADLKLIAAMIASAGIGTYLLVDRLSHQGGLSATVTTEQTTNLPTAALTRYTSGEGVMMALQIYTQIGATGTTVTCNYTNQAGTAGRTSQATAFGGAGFRELNRAIVMPLQEGDTGVRSVEGVTVLATTGTVGNFGVTLFRPLLLMPAPVAGQTFEWDALFSLGGAAPDIVDDACLSLMAIPAVTNSGIVQGKLLFAEN